MKPDPKQLRLAADIIEHNHPWEYLNGLSGRWTTPSNSNPLPYLATETTQIRPVLATPPDGRPLHNPNNLTADAVGVGYRLLLREELQNGEPHPELQWFATAEILRRDPGFPWFPGGGPVLESCRFRNKEYDRDVWNTFRLPLSVPWPDGPETKDPYAELKEAYKAGKTIQFNVGKYASPDAPDAWEDRENLHWDQPVHLYRVEPEATAFTLPPPPPGMRWHREDGWKEGDLPQGYRPCVKDEREHISGYMESLPDRDLGWVGASYFSSGLDFYSFLHRTTRPLTFTHAGKQWTWHRPGDPMPCDGRRRVQVVMVNGHVSPDFNGRDWDWAAKYTTSNHIVGWRYAEPETKEVELGPEDVPPCSSVRFPKGSDLWSIVTTAANEGILVEDKYMSFLELKELGASINRSIPLTGKWNPDAWEPCKKTISL